MAESEPIAEKLSSPSGAPLTALTWGIVPLLGRVLGSG
jgi:hypothetical protein